MVKEVQGSEDSGVRVEDKEHISGDKAAAFILRQSTASLRVLLKAGRGNLSLRAVIFIVFIMTFSVTGSAIAVERPHGDRAKLLKGCASCHKGHGVYNTPMLSERKDLFCFRCHGQALYLEKAKQEGDVAADVFPASVQREFEKPYHHPIEKIGIHRYGEILPEIDSAAMRHSACGDCHHHHLVTSDNKMSGIRGTNKDGLNVRITSEYELCFNCHSYSANLPVDQTNKAEIFNISNPSYHPIIAPGKNADVPSLADLSVTSLIKCTDCHNNDDVEGPRGPHGSQNRYILCRNFTTTDGSIGDSEYAYALCYGCHRSISILGNESFSMHNHHVVNVGVSCRSCHNPHGSLQYTHLIDFSNGNTTPSSSGQLGFVDLGNKAGQCFLTCHGVDHDPKTYPGAMPTSSPSLTPSLYPRRTK